MIHLPPGIGFDDLDPTMAPQILELADLIERAPERAPELLPVLEQTLLVASPSRMAMHVSGGAWKPYRHLVYLNMQLGRLARREITRLLVTMPPQHGKSITCSKFFPAWYLKRFPDHSIILCSYEADFAAQWGGEVRDVIDSEPEVFGFTVSKRSKARNRWRLNGHEGRMFTAGIGGPATGKGAHLFVIDDPVKNDEEAQSVAIQERNINWYHSVAHTRLRRDEDGTLPAVILLIQTRWHEADLAGKLLDEQGDKWTVVNLPALAEDDDPLGRARGDVLCPELHPLDDLEEARAGSQRVWASLYQQRPTTEGGGRFKKDHFRYWTSARADQDYYRLEGPLGVEIVPKAGALRFTTIDVASQTKRRSDWTVISTWDLLPPRVDDLDRERPSMLVLVDRERERVESVDHLLLLEHVDATLAPAWHGVEEATYGLQLIQSAIRKGFRIQPMPADRDKWSRSEIASTMVRNGRVFFPASAPWLDEWEHELLTFPNGSYDDQVDTLSYAAIIADQRRSTPRRSDSASLRDRMRRKARRPLHPVLGRL